MERTLKRPIKPWPGEVAVAVAIKHGVYELYVPSHGHYVSRGQVTNIVAVSPLASRQVGRSLDIYLVYHGWLVALDHRSFYSQHHSRSDEPYRP